jgi:hypothetical protein
MEKTNDIVKNVDAFHGNKIKTKYIIFLGVAGEKHWRGLAAVQMVQQQFKN